VCMRVWGGGGGRTARLGLKPVCWVANSAGDATTVNTIVQDAVPTISLPSPCPRLPPCALTSASTSASTPASTARVDRVHDPVLVAHTRPDAVLPTTHPRLRHPALQCCVASPAWWQSSWSAFYTFIHITLPSRGAAGFTVPTGKRVNTREVCLWTHLFPSFKRAGVGTNGILEWNNPNPNP
jgi:hypothetical protein